MLHELLDRELGWKAAPYMALLAVVLWPFMSAQPTANPVLFACLCFALVFSGRFHQRATLFEAALPIPGRQLVAARVLAVLAALWLPSLAVTGETWVLRGWRDALPLLEVAAVSSLAVLAMQSLRIRETRPPSWLTYPLGLAGGVFVLVPGVLSYWEAVLGFCFAASATLLARLWASVPQGFQIAPAAATRVRWFAVGRLTSHRVRLPVWWPAWRSFFHWRDWWYLLFIMFPAELGMSIVIGSWLVMPAVGACRRLEWLSALPISRRRLLLMMLLPWLCVLTAIVLWIGHFESATKGPMVSTGYSAVWQDAKSTGSGTPNVLAPACFWHWAWGWKAPTIQSPWGEKTEPRTFHRLGLAFYNPYTVGPNNSARFLDWQFARATEAVYGRSVPLSQSAELRKSGFIPVTRQLRTQCLAVVAATLPFMGMFWLLFWGRTRGGLGWTWLIVFGSLVPFFCDFFTAEQVRNSGPLSQTLTVHLAAILPQNWIALIVPAALLLGSLYLAVEKQFKRVDLIPDLRPSEGTE